MQAPNHQPTDSPRPGRWRHVRTVLLWTTLGLLSTVGVAVGSSLFHQLLVAPATGDPFENLLVGDETTRWQGSIRRGIGMTTVWAMGSLSPTDRESWQSFWDEHPEKHGDDLPRWSWARRRLQPDPTGVGPTGAHLSEATTGFPFPCLYGRELHNTNAVLGATDVGLTTPWKIPRPPYLTVRLPIAPLWPEFLADWAIHTLTLLALATGIPAARRRYRRRRNLCPRCGYPVSASPLCSECGQPVQLRAGALDPNAPPSLWAMRLWRWTRAIGLATSLGLVAISGLGFCREVSAVVPPRLGIKTMPGALLLGWLADPAPSPHWPRDLGPQNLPFVWWFDRMTTTQGTFTILPLWMPLILSLPTTAIAWRQCRRVRPPPVVPA